MKPFAKYLLILFISCSFLMGAQDTLHLTAPVRFLALGDSYTIGESVPATGRWPAQLRDSLLSRNIPFDTLRIIATTGWRTDNLLTAIKNKGLQHQHYNLVSLLIGVNNQYQNTPIAQFKTEFPQLLDSALLYAGGDTSHVFVVSIPDYAYTPYGQSTNNAAQISSQIDQYNTISKHMADSLHISYFDITPISRQGMSQRSLIASDSLHPSAAQYTKWVQLMLQNVITTFITTGVEQDYLTSLAVYPNPASNEVTINVENAFPAHAVCKLYNSNGMLVSKSMLTQSLSSLSLKELPAGLYTIRISGDHVHAVKRIIKE